MARVLPSQGDLRRARQTSAKRFHAHPVMARSLELQCPQVKRRRGNPALRWERSPAKAERPSAQEKSAEPPAISSAHAETRYPLCSDGHRGSIMQR